MSTSKLMPAVLREMLNAMRQSPNFEVRGDKLYARYDEIRVSKRSRFSDDVRVEFVYRGEVQSYIEVSMALNGDETLHITELDGFSQIKMAGFGLLTCQVKAQAEQEYRDEQ